MYERSKTETQTRERTVAGRQRQGERERDEDRAREIGVGRKKRGDAPQSPLKQPHDCGSLARERKFALQQPWTKMRAHGSSCLFLS